MKKKIRYKMNRTKKKKKKPEGEKMVNILFRLNETKTLLWSIVCICSRHFLHLIFREKPNKTEGKFLNNGWKWKKYFFKNTLYMSFGFHNTISFYDVNFEKVGCKIFSSRKRIVLILNFPPVYFLLNQSC